jgi:diguanylate cyclase (GGDEF)-like protein
MALARQNNSQLLEISYILEISRIHLVYRNPDKAEQELLPALQSAEKINSLTNISLIHERLVEVYKEKGEYQLALEHFEAFHTTFKKIFNDKSDRRIKNLEILHQVEISRKQTDLYRELAATDFLTGLVNMRSFLEIAEKTLQKAKNEKGQLAMIMLDIDYFKEVNDHYGHTAGDQALAIVAGKIKKSLRQGDIAGRYGGDEFIILVPGISCENCAKLAERIRRAVAQEPIQIEATSISVTISVGLVCFDPDQEISLNDLINCADQAMYLAKQQGRNCVVRWTQDTRP